MTADDLPFVPLDAMLCEQARLSRDARFDGLFFTAVTSTGIYCRPVCPAPAPKACNVRYYPTAAAAEVAGFRPCLRCRPELSPGRGSWQRGDSSLARALKLLDEGFLDAHSVADLAERVHMGERQLRRVFEQRLGASPLRVANTRRLLFAKQLLSETDLPITEVALACGFGSVRRFNAAVLAAWQMPPGRVRGERVGSVVAATRIAGSAGTKFRQAPVETPASAEPANALSLRLAYRPPYDFAGMLAFLRLRAIPGVESVGQDHYARTIFLPQAGDASDARCAYWVVRAWPDGVPALKLTVYGVSATHLPEVVRRVRHLFDLDADPASINARLAQTADLHALVEQNPGQRIPGAWDGFEMAVRAVLGQQVSVAAARTLAMRLVQRFGRSCPGVANTDRLDTADPRVVLGALTHGFPRAEVLQHADLSGLGLTSGRAKTIQVIAQAVLDGRVDFRPDQTLQEWEARWCALPGVGAWTAQYMAMRVLGHPNAFPAGDLVLQKAAARPEDGQLRLTAKALTARAQAWQPWRAYAVFHLWRAASSKARPTLSSASKECAS